MSEAQAESLLQSKEASNPESTAEAPTESSGPSFSDLIPQDYKADPSVTKFKDIGGLLKSYKELEKELGSRVKLPDVADDDGLSKLYNKLGRPETPDKYELSLEEDKKKFFDASTPENQEFLKSVHAAGLTNKQTNAIIQEYVKAQMKQVEQRVNEAALAENYLKEQWGEDGFKEKQQSINNMLTQYSAKLGKETIDHLAKEYGRNPALIVMLDDLAIAHSKAGQESHHVPSGANTYGLTADDAYKRIAEIRASDAYNKTNDPGHDNAVELMRQAYEALEAVGELKNRK